ncbi:pyocin knob domain-containing protein [Providencia hangzhouensis]
MYSTGTVTTTANSTKLVGAGTKWLNNINRVSAEQAIQIQIGTTVHNNSIQSIQSDTELTLNFPIPTAATGAKYVILTTMVHSASDAMNKIVSMNGANVQFSDILTRWMTEQGIITVTLPDQTTQQLRTTKEMDKQLDGKFDKSGGTISGDVTFSKDAIKSTKGTHALPAESGTLMQVGDFGVGEPIALKASDNLGKTTKTGIYMKRYTGNATIENEYPFEGAGTLIVTPTAGGNVLQEYRVHNRPGLIYYRSINDAGTSVNTPWISQYNTSNTTKDSNGNLKAASPIVRVFANDVDPNEEAEGVTLKKLHTGIYQLHGVLGLHSDASWGGINGGITIPCGINQLPLVYALYDVLEKGKPHPFDGRIVDPGEDGDIVLYTSYRQHDLPQNIQYERFKLYPEFLRDATEDEESIPGFDGKVELTPGEPCDIPVGHWVDVRVNMPSNSIYNQKQAEAEKLAKLEAERLAEEEAKRAVEEAERAEQEAVERKQYGLDDNSVLL